MERCAIVCHSSTHQRGCLSKNRLWRMDDCCTWRGRCIARHLHTGWDGEQRICNSWYSFLLLNDARRSEDNQRCELLCAPKQHHHSPNDRVSFDLIPQFHDHFMVLNHLQREHSQIEGRVLQAPRFGRRRRTREHCWCDFEAKSHGHGHGICSGCMPLNFPCKTF